MIYGIGRYHTGSEFRCDNRKPLKCIAQGSPVAPANDIKRLVAALRSVFDLQSGPYPSLFRAAQMCRGSYAQGRLAPLCALR
jgi:hypothetical protein